MRLHCSTESIAAMQTPSLLFGEQEWQNDTMMISTLRGEAV